MSQPKVSVIIPVYNTASYLWEAIGSIMQQTLTDIEILVVNDGSTDGSGEIIRELALQDGRIRFFEQENKGQSVARNVGLDHSSGKYVYFMDSDDLISSEALEVCYHYSERMQADFIFFDADIIYENNQQPICWDYHRTGRYAENIVYQGVELMDDMLTNFTHRAVPWLWLVKREYLCRIGLRFYPGIIHEDELFCTLLFVQSQQIGCLKRSLVKHRVRNHSTMTKHYSARNVNCYLVVIEQLFLYAGQHKELKSLVEKYAIYTLNAVLGSAYVLNMKDKICVFYSCLCKGYVKYISFKSLFLFIFKN